MDAFLSRTARTCHPRGLRWTYHARKKNNPLTPFHLLAFAVAFAMTGICTALALQGGSNPLTVVTLRTVVAIALLSGWLFYNGATFRLPSRERNAALLIGVPLCINNYLLNAAIEEIPVPLAVLIFYTWPALVTAASWLTGRERFRWRSAAGLALAFAGVALAVDVQLTAAQASGVWMALGAALMWSAAFLLTGHCFHGRDTRVPSLYMMATALAAFLAACLATGNVAWPHGAAGWSGMAGVGAFYAFEPLASELLAALIHGQRLAPVHLAGAGLVIAALFLFRPPPAAASPSRKS